MVGMAFVAVVQMALFAMNLQCFSEFLVYYDLEATPYLLEI